MDGIPDIAEDLLRAGYRKFNVPSFSHASEFYQKCIESEGVKKYFIGAYVYRHSHHVSLAFSVQFKYPKPLPPFPEDFVFNVETIGLGDIDTAEAFFHKIFNSIGCLVYE